MSKVRIVSLVPSLTEAVAETSPESLVGCTDWCTHPGWIADSGVARVRGTKNPDLEGVLALGPDLVLANEEENRQQDLDELARAGVEVLCTTIRSVPQALSELQRVVRRCGWDHPRWLESAELAWIGPAEAESAETEVEQRRRTALIPIWRRPWMAVGSDTYSGDVLARLGVDNILADSPERYPRFNPGEYSPNGGAAGPDLVVLPDEPYRFTADDGPEAFPGIRYALISGRLMSWYGPAMVQARAELPDQLRGQ